MNEHWKILYTKDALKDKKKAYEVGFKGKIERLLSLIKKILSLRIRHTKNWLVICRGHIQDALIINTGLYIQFMTMKEL